MNRRVWIGLCLFFCAFNLKLLIDDYDQVNYMIVEKSDPLYDEANNYSLCVAIDSIGVKNDLNYDPDEPRMVSAGYFLNQTVASIEKKINCTGLFKATEGFVLNDFVCFPVNKSRLENDSPLNLFIKQYTAFLNIHSNGRMPRYYESFYLGDQIYIKIQKQKVYNRNFLTTSDCHEVRGQLARSRFTCLNECFRRFNLSFAAYPYDEDTYEFDLNLIAKNLRKESFTEQIEFKNFSSINIRKKINKKFIVCLQECPQRDCFYETFNMVTIRKLYYDKIISKTAHASKISLQTFIYAPYYSTPLWEFFLQFFGLLTLFTNTSVISIVTFLVVLLAKKLKLDGHRYFGIAFPKFKTFIFVFCLLFASVQSGLMIHEFCFKSFYPNQTSALTFISKFSPFSVVVCLPVELLIDDTEKIRKGRNDHLLATYTCEDLKNKTDDALGNGMIWAHLYLGHKVEPFELKDKLLSENVLFRNITCGDFYCLARCFFFKIELEETRYESLLPTNLLKFSFRSKHWRAFLIEDGQPFTTATRNFKGEFYARKYREENLPTSRKSNCKHYSETPKAPCQTRLHCVDRCVVRKYIERYRKLPVFSIVDMYALNLTSRRFKFTTSRNLSIEKECLEEFNQNDCLVILFYESLQTSYAYHESYLNINLYFETLIVNEIQQSPVKLVLNILNLESIFFGSNLTTLLLALVLYLKKRFKYRWHRIYRFLIFLVGLAGFILHVTSIFHGIIKDPLAKIGYFKQFDKPILPNQIFCFEFDESKIDPNVKLTGRYLDELTNELNYETIFKKFWYINGTDFISFQPRKANNSNSEISLTYWYYLNNKCFEVAFKVRLSEEDLYLIQNQNLIGITFSNKFARQYGNQNRTGKVFFMFRMPGTRQFSNSFFFDIKPVDRIFYTYDIVFEHFRIVEEDKFEALRDPRKLFVETINIDDATAYIENLVGNFRNDHNLTAREVSLEENEAGGSSFELEVDDGLFKQHYSQVQNISDHRYPSCGDSKKSFYSIYIQYNRNTLNQTMFRFSISLTSKETNISNEDNYAKLVQNILNSLSLFLNVSILECHLYVGKIFIIFTFLYGGLLKLKVCLRNACTNLSF